MPASLRPTAKGSQGGRTRSHLLGLLSILSALGTPLMMWKGLSAVAASSMPIVCVISESMAPAFHKGDLLFLSNRSNQIQAGDIPVVWFSGRPLPMVHRAIRVLTSDESDEDGESSTPRQLIVTKGDNNEVDDVPMYPDGQAFVTRAEIMGLVVAYVPYLGWVSIALQKVFETKYLVLLVVIAVSLAS